jgi:hypothetical protein
MLQLMCHGHAAQCDMPRMHLPGEKLKKLLQDKEVAFTAAHETKFQAGEDEEGHVVRSKFYHPRSVLVKVISKGRQVF